MSRGSSSPPSVGPEPVNAATHLVGPSVSGIGSWPGTDPREAIVTVRDLLADTPDGVTGVPYLPELPGRGPGADMIGRTAALLVDLPVDLQPSGWRLVDRPGKDLSRGEAFWRHDLDEWAEAYDGWRGPLKLSVCGPWTLVACIELMRGERVLTDPGATRDVRESLTEGICELLTRMARLVPGAELMLQLDEPALAAVLEGSLPTASGYGRARCVEAPVATSALSDVIEAVRPQVSGVSVHTCAPRVPWDVLKGAGADALAMDVALLGDADADPVAELLEGGRRWWAGTVPSVGETPTPAAATERALRTLAPLWRRTGLARQMLDQVTVTPACGLASHTPATARAMMRACVDAAARVAGIRHGDDDWPS